MSEITGGVITLDGAAGARLDPQGSVGGFSVFTLSSRAQVPHRRLVFGSLKPCQVDHNIEGDLKMV